MAERHRAPVADAELRRRLRVLGPRLSERAVPDGLRDQRARPREGQGLRGAAAPARSRPSRTSRTSRRTTRGATRRRCAGRSAAYALYTRKQLGDLDLAKGQKLLSTRAASTSVTMETDGWLLGLFAQQPAAAERAQDDPALRDEPRQRDRGRGELHDELRRRRLPAARERSAGRRRDARVADPGAAGQRPDPEGRDRAARASQGGPLAQHPGELVRAARARSVLPHLREGDAGLRRAGVARRRLRGRSPVQGPPDRLLPARDSDEGCRDARQGSH